MKNLLTIFLLVIMAQIFAQTNKSQTIVSKPCDCGSWSGKPVKYQSTASPTSPALQGTINCNDSFTLHMGAYTFTAPVYNCS